MAWTTLLIERWNLAIPWGYIYVHWIYILIWSDAGWSEQPKSGELWPSQLSYYPTIWLKNRQVEVSGQYCPPMSRLSALACGRHIRISNYRRRCQGGKMPRDGHARNKRKGARQVDSMWCDGGVGMVCNLKPQQTREGTLDDNFDVSAVIRRPLINRFAYLILSAY